MCGITDQVMAGCVISLTRSWLDVISLPGHGWMCDITDQVMGGGVISLTRSWADV